MFPISYLIYICPDSSSRPVLRSQSSEATLVFLVLISNLYLLNLLTLHQGVKQCFFLSYDILDSFYHSIFRPRIITSFKRFRKHPLIYILTDSTYKEWISIRIFIITLFILNLGIFYCRLFHTIYFGHLIH